MSFGKVITLSNGATIPQIGLGTWLSEPHEVENAVYHAVKHGYRHLDLAMIYENQDEVGRALKKLFDEGVVKREDLFITSKLWNSSHQPQNVEKELAETLNQLGIPYLDLYLIHWPIAFPPGNGLNPPHPTKEGELALDLETSLVDTWKAMIKLPKEKVRAVGVSNFTIPQIEGIVKATDVVPVVNQIEAHPYLPQDELVEFAKKHNIHLTAYSPLGNNLIGLPKLTDVDEVKAIAKKLGATEAQVLVAWGAYRGYSVVPKSVKAERIESNFKQIELSREDYEAITNFGKTRHCRFNIPFRYKPKWDIRIFGEEPEKDAANDINIGA